MLHPGSCPQGWNGDVGNFNNQARARDLAGHGATNVGILECVGERITAYPGPIWAENSSGDF